MSIGILIFVVFLVCLLLRVPIAYSMIISATVALLSFNIVQPSFLVQTLYTAGESFTLLAVPMFILAGELMLVGGLSQRLINFGLSLFGHKNGALATVTIFACAIFAALSGSGPATAAAIGSIMIPAMVKDGYDRGFSATLAAAGGCLGPIIPPSICFVLYASIANVSISDLFAGGIIPGIVMALCLAGYVKYACVKNKFGISAWKEKSSPKDLWLAFKDAFWALLVPAIILGGIYGGIFTPTEAAVIACDYALIIGIFVYKEIKIKDIIPIVIRAAITSGTVLVLVGCASTFSRLLTLERIPTMIADSILSVSNNKIIILLLINIMLFVAGMFIETIAAMMIMTPLLLPITAELGISPVHLGIFMVVNLVIGMITPPMGCNLFITSKVGQVPLGKMVKWVIPMVISLLFALMLITYIPQLSLFLPDLLRTFGG